MKERSDFIQEYCRAAVAHCEAVENGNAKKAYKESSNLIRMGKKLETDRLFAEAVIKELLNNPNQMVLGWAAADALWLNIDIENAQTILKEIIETPEFPLLSFTADMNLKEWRKKQETQNCG